MIPYKMKHKATGLYYKPGRPNLSKILIGFVKTRFLYMVSMKILPNIIRLPLKRYLHIFI